MFWELSGDDPSGSLLTGMSTQLRNADLDMPERVAAVALSNRIRTEKTPVRLPIACRIFVFFKYLRRFAITWKFPRGRFAGITGPAAVCRWSSSL